MCIEGQLSVLMLRVRWQVQLIHVIEQLMHFIAVAYLGGGTWSDVHPLLNFFQHVIIYIVKIMGLLHASRVQRKKLDILFQYSHRDIELNYNLILTSLVQKSS